MNNDAQIKHHIYWIIKTIWPIEDYESFMDEDLSSEVCQEIDELVQHIKIIY